MTEVPLLRVVELVKNFSVGGGVLTKAKSRLQALNGVSFSLRRGESFGLVGESGCGKTTLGRLILRLIEPTNGCIEFDGRNIFSLGRSELKALRRRVQIIFQDPYSSLDPRMKVEAIVTEALWAAQYQSRKERRNTAAALLAQVGLQAADMDKYPHEFSGGQRQRIGIARALCVRPELIVADEPVSALDLSVQAQILNLLSDLRQTFKLSFVFISHDLCVVEHICDTIAVMYFGTIVEQAPVEEFSRAPRHPYTRILRDSIPSADPHIQDTPSDVPGEVPNPIDPPTGCAFHPRCRYQSKRCRLAAPELVEVSPGHRVACWCNHRQGIIEKDTNSPDISLT